jgi:hypothetical protein
MMTLEEEWVAAAAVPEPERRGVPWEDPQLSGWLGFYRTLREILFSPEEFFENLGPGGWAEPLTFALIVSTTGLLGALFWDLLLLAGTGSPGDSAGFTLSPSLGPVMLMGLMVGSPLLVLYILGVGGLCWWGSVALLGADREFTPAWRIFCYAQGGMILALIPFLGTLVAGIWVLALMFIGARKVFGFSALSSLGALVIFLIFQALLGMILLLGLSLGLAGLGLLTLLLG